MSFLALNVIALRLNTAISMTRSECGTTGVGDWDIAFQKTPWHDVNFFTTIINTSTGVITAKDPDHRDHFQKMYIPQSHFHQHYYTKVTICNHHLIDFPNLYKKNPKGQLQE